MIIDSHSHVHSSVESHLNIMDESNIDKTVLFSTLVHPEKNESYSEFVEEMGKLSNILANRINSSEARIKAMDELIRTVRQYPDRFIGFGSIPLGFSETETMEWVETKIVNNGLRGFGEFTLGSGQIGLLDPVFKAANEWRGLPIWVHTFEPLKMVDIRDLAYLVQKNPNVPVIFGHLGGLNWLDTINLTKDIDNAYLDTSAVYTVFALSLAMKELPDRTLFSSDHPYGDPYLAKIAVQRCAPSKEVERRVLGETIAELLEI
ncbi:amidohydrolase family protein [Brevibacillus sp. RS1.1]|uniref:amidohydrolase family protein n=1 Tax=Brevibacillus sp. RS1.1 TaxID=2738982 RepID=UPI00156B3D5C|nr:amidohydrolase family protein [Brevibacillus sp. RS1.1]NRR03934.1 amidohydrolase family protein [Brevibacillus sp. RS1.1]